MLEKNLLDLQLNIEIDILILLFFYTIRLAVKYQLNN
jgi:hypothetical protein